MSLFGLAYALGAACQADCQDCLCGWWYVVPCPCWVSCLVGLWREGRGGAGGWWLGCEEEVGKRGMISSLHLRSRVRSWRMFLSQRSFSCWFRPSPLLRGSGRWKPVSKQTGRSGCVVVQKMRHVWVCLSASPLLVTVGSAELGLSTSQGETDRQGDRVTFSTLTSDFARPEWVHPAPNPHRPADILQTPYFVPARAPHEA